MAKGIGTVVKARVPVAGLYQGEWFLFAFPGCHGIITHVLERDRVRVSWEPQGSGITDVHRSAVEVLPDTMPTWRVIDTNEEKSK